MDLKKLICTLFFLFLIPFFGYSLVRQNWPTFMGNQYLTGNNDGIIPEGDNVIWKFDTQGKLFNPVSVNNQVYVVSTDGYLYCLDANNGSLLWKFKAEGPLTRMVVVYEGMVYLPAGRFLYCLDEKTGEVIWARRDPSYGFYGTPTINGKKIFYGNRKRFYARNLENGHLIWENHNIYTYGGFPSCWERMVYTVSKEFQQDMARLYAIDADTGEVIWFQVLTNDPEIYSPLIFDGKIYLALGSKLLIFKARDGEKISEISFPISAASNPVFSQNSIFLSLKDGTILKIDPDTGDYNVLCRVSYGTQFAVVGSYLFVPDKKNPGACAVIDAETGTLVKEIIVAEGEPSALTIEGGTMFIPAGNALLAIGKGKELVLTREPAEKSALEKEKDIAREEIEKKKVEDTTFKTIKGEVKDIDTGKPLSGRVEAQTELKSGDIVKTEKPITEGKFEIEVPGEGRTDLIVSSPGYVFQTITLPDEKAIDDLSLQPLELSLTPARKGEEIVTHSIQFKIESANLQPSSLSALENVLNMLKENPHIKIEIAGHTDSTGTSEFNYKLSRLRAETVRDWLIRNGISSERLSAKGYGESKPIADNSTPEGRAKNRRTEIRLIEK